MKVIDSLAAFAAVTVPGVTTTYRLFFRGWHSYDISCRIDSRIYLLISPHLHDIVTSLQLPDVCLSPIPSTLLTTLHLVKRDRAKHLHGPPRWILNVS